MTHPGIIWTFEYNDELRDYQCDTAQETEISADEWFYKHWDDCYLREGEWRTDQCYIVGIDNDGKEVARYKHKLYYENTSN